MRSSHFLYTIVILRQEVFQKNKPPGSLASLVFWRESMDALPLSSSDLETLGTFPTSGPGERPATPGHRPYSPHTAWRKRVRGRNTEHPHTLVGGLLYGPLSLAVLKMWPSHRASRWDYWVSCAYRLEGLRKPGAERLDMPEEPGSKRAESKWGQGAREKHHCRGKRVTHFLRSFTTCTLIDLVSLTSFTSFPFSTATQNQMRFLNMPCPSTLPFFTCCSFRMEYPPHSQFPSHCFCSTVNT